MGRYSAIECFEDGTGMRRPMTGNYVFRDHASGEDFMSTVTLSEEGNFSFTRTADMPDDFCEADAFRAVRDYDYAALTPVGDPQLMNALEKCGRTWAFVVRQGWSDGSESDIRLYVDIEAHDDAPLYRVDATVDGIALSSAWFQPVSARKAATDYLEQHARPVGIRIRQREIGSLHIGEPEAAELVDNVVAFRS